jgi:class 3 adenylate cyclase
MPALPTGTVTFLLNDVEGSTRLWEQHPAAMRAALARRDALIEAVVEQHQGVLVRPRGEGDSRFAVFSRAVDALSATVAVQEALHTEAWAVQVALRVRMPLHTGDAEPRDGDYYGSAVNRCARLRGIAHGGQILLSQTTYDLVQDALSPGVSLRDLGEHRLADLQRPERVFQIVAAGLPDEFPPLRSLESVPHNLPLQLTSFVGREREMAEVAHLLGQTRLLTLTGVGGTGKTRLALQVAAERLTEYRQGVWLVELAPLADPALVPQTVAAVLGVRADGRRLLLATLTEVLRPKHLLIVLDNCEHLIDACAQLTDALLRACPTVQVLLPAGRPWASQARPPGECPRWPCPRPKGSRPWRHSDRWRPYASSWSVPWRRSLALL